MSLETNIPQVNQNFVVERQHSAVIAYLGQLALSQPSAADLFADVVTLLAHILPAEFVWLWELNPGGKQLTLRGNSSWKNEAAVESQVPLEPNSLEELALRSPYPILVHELSTDARFQQTGILKRSGATSGIAVTVGTPQEPYGILLAFSPHLHSYSRNDLHFFHSVANILALFIKKEKLQSSASADRIERDQDEIKNRLVDGRERERLRLAQELHDVPVQDIYGLMYQLDDLKEFLKDTEGMQTLEEFNSTLHRVVNNLRTICGELRPPSLSPFGFEVAIRDHVEKLRAMNPDLHFHLDLMSDQQSLSDNIRLRLFRIYQQAINNVIRHAQATEVSIRFRWDDQTLILEVDDNGIGFEVPERWVDLVRQEQFGLAGIAERVESMQGKLEIVSTPGTGTTVRVSVPRR